MGLLITRFNYVKYKVRRRKAICNVVKLNKVKKCVRISPCAVMSDFLALCAKFLWQPHVACLSIKVNDIFILLPFTGHRCSLPYVRNL